jgi:23S rRNA (adenine2503-C2)-methyltransferase
MAAVIPFAFSVEQYKALSRLFYIVFISEIMNKKFLLGLTLEQLKVIVAEAAMPSFTAKQISEWLYHKKVTTIEEMTNISQKNRALLSEKYEVGRTLPVHVQTSVDGTKKYLFQTPTGQFVETVYIPEDDRHTLCVSSQVGCKMNCKFCMTGKMGFIEQLTPTEIINQILSLPESSLLTNIVFMGMGEPFDNLESILTVLEIITADYGLAWSPRRVTVSTIGHLKGMKAFLEKSQCHLAISLHSPFHAERLSLMPIEKAYPAQEVLAEIRKYDFSKQRRVSFEYIMFNDLNDTVRHAVELVKILKGIDCRVNLIRFHAIPGVDLKTSDNDKMIAFRDYLTRNGITNTIRKSRGEDIFAACGMLSTSKKTENQK